jgi:hypothetical protein
MDPRFVKLQNGNKETILFAAAQVFGKADMRSFISELLK